MQWPFGCWCLNWAQIAHFHTQLLCSGKIVSIKVRGRYATAVFRMGDREGISKCRPGARIAARPRGFHHICSKAVILPRTTVNRTAVSVPGLSH
jgi:hypothetical protein